MKILGFLICFLLALSIGAETVEVRIEYPVLRVDESALPIDEIAHAVVRYGTCGVDAIDQTAGEFQIVPPAVVNTFEYGPGEVCVQAAVVDTDGGMSSWTGVAYGQIPDESSVPAVPVIIELRYLPKTSGEWVVAQHPTKPNYTTVASFLWQDQQLRSNVGLVEVGVPCDCVALRVDADTKMTPDSELGPHCSIEGRLQTQFNKPVARGEPYPFGYVAHCVEVSP